MSISDWSNYKGKTTEIKWSKDDLLAHLDEVKGEPENVSETSSGGLNFMHVACAKGWQDIVEKLNQLKRQGRFTHSLNAQDNNGVTPVMEATYAPGIHKKTNIAKYLLEQGADPTVPDDKDSNLLHYACAKGMAQGKHFFIQNRTYLYSLGCRITCLINFLLF